MTESDEPRPRPRWFQFDLRMLFVVIAAVAVILAIEAARDRKSNRRLLETFKAGDSVIIFEHDYGFAIHVGSSDASRGRNGTVSEVGEDFLLVRWQDSNYEAFIPLDRIHRIDRFPSARPI